jgi:hypothetical protein
MVDMAIRKWARRNWWKLAVVSVAGWTGLYIALIAPMQYRRSVAEQKAAGLGAVAWEPTSLWRQRQRLPMLQKVSTIAHLEGAARMYLDTPEPNDADRKIVRTGSLEMEVKSPAAAAGKVNEIAIQMGGEVMSSEASGNDDSQNGAIAVRVPASRFEEAMTAIKKLSVRIENEKTDARDFTKEYADKDAGLRNLRAQETQYLAIMKRAATVKDTLDVSEKLGEVRGQIEQQQAEFAALNKQVESAAINVSLRAEADAQILGVHWRPLYQLKLAAREGLEGLGDYVASMTIAIFHLPAFLLWLTTLIFTAAIGWRLMRWVWRKFFHLRQTG